MCLYNDIKYISNIDEKKLNNNVGIIIFDIKTTETKIRWMFTADGGFR